MKVNIPVGAALAIGFLFFETGVGAQAQYQCFADNGVLKGAISLYSYGPTGLYQTNVLARYGPIEGWCFTPALTSMRNLLNGVGAEKFNADISRWDLSNVQDTAGMFSNAKVFNIDISGWNVSRVYNFARMFENAVSFNIDISRWDVRRTSICPTSRSQVDCSGVAAMFRGATAFNQNLCSWGPKLGSPRTVPVSTVEMFLNSGCPVKKDPNITSSPPGPFCRQCPAGPCFSGENMIEDLRKGEIKMKDLEVGDKIKSNKDMYDTVYAFGHYDASSATSYLQIKVQGLNKPLEISPNHLVYLKSKGSGVTTTIPASIVRVGDDLVLADGQSSSPVETITTVTRSGLFAPFTTSGTLVVSGVLASSYVSLHEDSRTLCIGNYCTPISMHWLSHAFTFPRRLFCVHWHMWWCGGDDNDNGIPHWVSGPKHFFEQILKEHVIVQGLVLLPYIMYACIVSALEYLLASRLLFMVVSLLALSFIHYGRRVRGPTKKVRVE